MPKQVMMWESKDGNLFDYEEEAVLHDALENLRGMHQYLNDNEIELLNKIIKDNDFRKAFEAYTKAKHAADEAEKKRHEHSEKIKNDIAARKIDQCKHDPIWKGDYLQCRWCNMIFTKEA